MVSSEDTDLEDLDKKKDKKDEGQDKGKKKKALAQGNADAETTDEDKQAETSKDEATDDSDKSEEGEEAAKNSSTLAQSTAGKDKNGRLKNGSHPYGWGRGPKHQRNYFRDKNWRAKGREEGDYGFDEPDAVEDNPEYRKQMDRMLGLSRKIGKQPRGWGYPYGYGYGNGYGKDRCNARNNYCRGGGYGNHSGYSPYGQGHDYNPMGAADDPFEDDEKDDKEHEGYYPRDGETEDELFLHDLHRYGYEKYKDSDISPDRRNNYNGYYNPYYYNRNNYQ